MNDDPGVSEPRPQQDLAALTAACESLRDTLATLDAAGLTLAAARLCHVIDALDTYLEHEACGR